MLLTTWNIAWTETKVPKKRGFLRNKFSALTQTSQHEETIPLPHPFLSTPLMGNWSCLERNLVQHYQGWERGVNSGRDASEVKPLIMITNWSWLLERQAAAVGRSVFEVPPACCRVPGPLAWGDAGTMWLLVGKNVMRRQGDGAQDGWRVDGLTGPAGGLVVRTLGKKLGMTQGDERVRKRLWIRTVLFSYTLTHKQRKTLNKSCTLRLAVIKSKRFWVLERVWK